MATGQEILRNAPIDATHYIDNCGNGKPGYYKDITPNSYKWYFNGSWGKGIGTPVYAVSSLADFGYTQITSDIKECARAFADDNAYYMSANEHDKKGVQYTKITTLEELYVAHAIYRKV